MTTPPPQLPFPLESGWDYILTEADRKRCTPKLPTDEYFLGNSKVPWVFANSDSMFYPHSFYRRRKPASGWVKLKADCLPELNRPFWGMGGSMPVCFGNGLSNPQNILGLDYSHWRYCEGSYQIPPPPEPEREAWEVAFEAADKEAQSKLVGPTADCWAFTAGERKASFKAGWDAKAKEGK